MKMTSRKKQEENHLKILKDLLSQPANKKCLECDQRGPTYVDVTIGSFVCTSCGGLLRGLNPPHRVKSISMTTFTSAEISFIEGRGNEWCRAVYLAKYDEQSRAKPESKNDHQKLKHFLELKYEQKRWYESPSQQRKLMESVAAAAKKNRENASPPAVRPLHNLLGSNVNNVQIPTAKAEISKEISHSKINKPSSDLLSDLNPPSLVTNNQGFGSPQIQQTSSSSSSGFADGFADFDKAFGGFTSAPAPTSQPAFAAFGSISTDPIPFTNDTSGSMGLGNPQKNAQSASTNSVDKYAALAELNLFKMEPQKETSEFSWSSPAKPAFSTNAMSSAPQTQPIFGMSQQPQQNNLFNSTPMPNLVNTAPVASSTSWMTTPSAAPSWSSTSSQWNPSSTTWQPTYQPPVANNTAAASSNPFFTPAPAPTNQQPNLFGQTQVNSTPNDFGPFTQPAAPAMGGFGSNTAMMSSTNPFAMSGPMPSNHGYIPQQPQAQPVQPMMNNPSNPFMF